MKKKKKGTDYGRAKYSIDGKSGDRWATDKKPKGKKQS